MLDHVTIRVSDRAASERFYRTVLGTLGMEPSHAGEDLVKWENDFQRVQFRFDDDATVDAFHRAATDAGHRDNGAPGERAGYHPAHDGAYVLDPDGNNVEVVNHNR